MGAEGAVFAASEDRSAVSVAVTGLTPSDSASTASPEVTVSSIAPCKIYDQLVGSSSGEPLAESLAGDDAPQSVSGLDAQDPPQADAADDPPRRKRKRHPRARGGRKVQEAKARKAARIAAREAAAAEAGRDAAEADSVDLAAERGGVGIIVEAETARALGEAEGVAVTEVEVEAACGLAATSDTAIPGLIRTRELCEHSAGEPEDMVAPETKKRRRRLRSHGIEAKLVEEHLQDLSADSSIPEDHAESSSESTPISASSSKSSSLSLCIMSQPPTPPLSTLRAWPSQPFVEPEDEDVSQDGDLVDAVVALPLGPLEPLSPQSEEARNDYTRSPRASHRVVRPPPALGPMCLPRIECVDTSLASNAHCGSRLPASGADVKAKSDTSTPRPQLSESHYALLQTLFPDGDPGTPHKCAADDSLPPQAIQDSGALSAQVDVPADTLVDDLLATQKEISGLKGSMATLLARMDCARSMHSLTAASSSAEREQVRAVHTLRSLMKDMEKISRLTVRMAAAVQSEMTPSMSAREG